MWPDSERPWYGTFIKAQAESLVRIGVEVDPLPIRGYSSRVAYLAAAGDLVRRGRRRRYDIVHAHYGHAAAIARLQIRSPLVISYCGDDLLGTPRDDGSLTARSRMEALAFRRLAYVAAATITKSMQMERMLPASRRTRNHVIPSGVDLDRFRPLPRDEARRQVAWDPEERTILFAGDPGIARKNYALAEAACRQASRSEPNLRLRVANGMPPAEIPTVMNAADALLLTSRWEGSPNVVKEAMACELPVVAVPVGDVGERLDGVQGCFLRPAEATPLSEGLIAAIRQGRAPAARAAVASLSLERVARRVLAVYEKALAG